MPQMRRFGLATCLQGYIMWAWECEPRCQLCSLLDSTCNCCNTVSPAGPAYSYPRLVSRPHPSFLSSAVCKAAVKAVECSLFGSTWSWASSEVIRHSSIRGWKSHSIPMQDIFLSLLHLSPTRTNIHSHTKLTHKTHISPPPPSLFPTACLLYPNKHSLTFSSAPRTCNLVTWNHHEAHGPGKKPEGSPTSSKHTTHRWARKGRRGRWQKGRKSVRSGEGGKSQSGVEVIQVIPQSPTSYRPWD